MKKRAICVLGGTGFVGSHLVSQLARQGHRIRVLTRHRERHRHLLVLPTVDVVEADVHDPHGLEQWFAGQDAVINLVGILNEKGDSGKGFARAHVELADKVVSACRATGVRRLLHMSALHADVKGPSHYLRTKGQAEDLVHAAAGEDLQVTSFRPAVIFGPGDDFFNRFARLLRLAPYYFPLACPHTKFAPVFVSDVVQAYVIALDVVRTAGQRYDLCGPRVYSLQELVEYTAKVMGLRRRIIPLGDRLSRLQANLLEHAPGKPFSRDNYRSLGVDSVCNGPFPEIFGIRPTPLEAEVPRYLTGSGVRAHLRRRGGRT